MISTAQHRSAELIVVGLGPAGRALTHRAAAAGIDVLAVDPHPARRWTPTYSAWKDELPDWLPESVLGSVTDAPAAWTTRRQPIERSYCVLDTSALQDALDVSAAHVLSATAGSLDATSVTLTDGTALTGAAVVDARGASDIAGLAEQTAFGVVVSRDEGTAVLEGTGAWFMDWRLDNGAHASAPPSFLYAVELDSERILLEETCLVGRPALGFRELEMRLRTRLAARGLSLSGSEPVERVKFPVQPPPGRPAASEALRFGARSSMMHPATGYSVAASLAATDTVLAAIRRRRRSEPVSVRTVQQLRNLGLRTALGLAPELVPRFFASFFDLPVHLQAAYLSGRTDALGTARAMTRMFPTLPTSARIAIARTLVHR